MTGSQSFGITSATNYYEQLFRPRYDSFLQESASSEAAILFAIVAYHLREWVWHNKGSLDLPVAGLTSTTESDFNASVNSQCPAYPVIRTLANGSKHCVLKSKSAHVRGTGTAKWGELEWGDFASDRPTLKVELDDGSLKSVDAVFREVADFWEQFFAKQVST